MNAIIPPTSILSWILKGSIWSKTILWQDFEDFLSCITTWNEKSDNYSGLASFVIGFCGHDWWAFENQLEIFKEIYEL